MAEKKEVELLKPKIDLVFQSLFSQKNEEITKNFIEALLNEKVNKLSINGGKELFREYPEDKLGILDLELDVNEKEKVDVEVQLLKKDNFVPRLIYYFSKMYEQQIHKGEDYGTIKRVVLIAIVDFEFDLAKELKEAETQWLLRCTKHPEIVLTKLMEFNIIEIGKAKNNYKVNKEDEKNQWMLFLDNPNSREVQEIMEKNEKIKEAVIEVKKMSEDEKMRRLADLREKAILDEKEIYKTGLHEGENIGLEKGKTIGEAKAKREDAIAMIKEKMSNEVIARVTGLTVDEIEELRKSV